MSYHQSFIQASEDGLSARQVFCAVEPEEVAAVEQDIDKSLKSHTVTELVEIAKNLGVPEDVVGHLKKAELVDAIERMTASDED